MSAKWRRFVVNRRDLGCQRSVQLLILNTDNQDRCVFGLYVRTS
jgi:hypothetical protein